MEKYTNIIMDNPFVAAIAIAIALDTILGILRAAKERKFNSTVGINGGIRKIAMIICIIALCFADNFISLDFLFMIPDELMNKFGLTKLGLSEFFSLIFILYECASILKNMVLCGLPVPKKAKDYINKFLIAMTDEMPHETDSKEDDDNND